MTLEGVRYVFAAYGLAFFVLLVWIAMIAKKVARLASNDAPRSDRERAT